MRLKLVRARALQKGRVGKPVAKLGSDGLAKAKRRLLAGFRADPSD